MSRILLLVLIIQLVFPWATYAQESPVESPASLDLSSTERNVAASSVLPDAAQAVINLGGLTRSVTTTDMLTAAEMVAVRQVFNTGNQYLQLNDVGAAVGGGLHLQYYAANGLGNLVIPEGVRASQNAAVLQSLNLTGNLTNSGTLNIFSSNAAVTSASVNAANIYNNVGATISSTLATLNLNAVNNIVNAGTITSAGALNITAGGSITNLGVMQAINNLTAQAATMVNTGTMMAQLGNVNAVTSNLVNSGVMQALAGKMNISNLASSNVLMIDSINGVMSAARELSIINNMTTFDSQGNLLSKGRLGVTGGTFSGSSVNFSSPSGIVGVAAEEISGPVNVAGGFAAVGVERGLLHVNSMEITGTDPIFSSGGNLELNLGGILQTPVVGGSYGGLDFIALAGGNITAADTQANSLSSAMGTPNGGKIVLASGVTFTVSNPNCSTCSTPGDYSITGASTGGGNVNLGNNSFMTNNNDITVIAESGTTNAGNVSINGLNAYGVNSNVSITADGDVQLGSLSSFAGNSFTITAGGEITPIGTITANNVTLSGGGDVNLRQDITATNEIQILTTSDITRTNGTLTATSVTLDATGNIGTATDNVVVNTPTVGATSNANVYVTSINPGITQMALSAAGSSHTFSMTSLGSLFPGQITGNIIVLTTTGANSRMMSTGNITAGSTLSYFTNNLINGASQSAGTSITVTGDNLFVTDVGGVFGGGTLTAPSINFVASSGSLSVNQEQLSGTVNASTSENLILHVDNTSGFTLGTITTPNAVNNTPFGGITYYSGAASDVFFFGAAIALSTGTSNPTINATINGSQEITSLEVDGQSAGNLLVFVAATNLADTLVTNDGDLLLDNPYSSLSLETVSATGNVIVGAGGTITTTGTSTIEGNNISLRTNGNNPDVVIGNGVGATGILSIDSLINIEQSGGSLSAAEVNLQVYVGHIGTSGAHIITEAPEISANARLGTDVYLTSSYGGAVDLNASSAGTDAGETFLFTTSSDSFDTTGTIYADTIILQGSTNGMIVIGDNLIANSQITISALGTGHIFHQGGVLTAPAISISTDTGNTFGSQSRIILGSAQSIQALEMTIAASSNNGGIYISNQSNMLLHIDASDVGLSGHLLIESTSSMEVVGDLEGNDVTLAATGALANITLSANITTDFLIDISTAGAGAITQSDNSYVLTSGLVLISTDLGNIGSMAANGSNIQRINVDTDRLTVANHAYAGSGFQGTPSNQGGARAIVFVRSLNTGTTLLEGYNGSALQEFSLIADGDLTIQSGAVVQGTFITSQGLSNPAIVIQAPTITLEAGAVVQNTNHGQAGAILLNTNTLNNDGQILGDSIYITSLGVTPGQNNLTITGAGSLEVDFLPGFVDQGYIHINSSAAVDVEQGKIHGYVTNGTGFQMSVTSYTATSFGLEVDTGTLHVGRIASSGVVTITNQTGDIQVGNNNDQLAAITGTNITLSVNGESAAGEPNGTISLGPNASVDASGNLVFNTPILSNNTGALLYNPSGAGSFSGNTSYILNTTLTLDIHNGSGSSQYNGTWLFLWGLPQVHGQSSITIQNTGSGDLLVSGIGGMYTGSTTGVAVKSGDYSGIGTGNITMSAPNGSVVASQSVLMGNIVLTAKTTQDSFGNAGLAMLDVGFTGLYTFSNYNETAFLNNTNGFEPKLNQVTPGTPQYGTWHPNTATNSIQSMSITAAGTQGSQNFSFGTFSGTTYYKAPSIQTVNGILLLSSLFNGGPTIVVNTVPSGNYVVNSNLIIGTQGPADPQGNHSHPANTLVVHTSLPVQVNGNMTVSSTGNVYFDSGSFGAFNIGSDNVAANLTATATGNLAFNGTGAVIFSDEDTNSGFVHEVYVPNGRINLNVNGQTSTNFFNNGSQIFAGRIDATFTGTGAGRIITGQMQTINTSNAQNGNITITNSISPSSGTSDIQIGYISAYGSVSMLNEHGDFYMDGQTIIANDGNDLYNGTISLTAEEGSMYITLNSNILPSGAAGNGSSATIEYNGDFVLSNKSRIGTSSDTTVTVTDLSSDPGSGHSFTIYKSFIDGTNVYINTSGSAHYSVGGAVGNNGGGNLNVTHHGDLLFEGGISSNGGSVVMSNFGNLTIGNYLGASLNSNGGTVTVQNQDGNLLITNDSQILGNNGISISNTGGDLTINNSASINSIPQGSPELINISVSNSGGLITIETKGTNPSGGANSFQGSPNFGMGQRGGSLVASGSITITNDEAIEIYGPGSDSVWAPGGLLLISSESYVYVEQYQISSTVLGQSKETFGVQTTGSGLTVGNIFANPDGTGSDGSIELIAGTGTLQVLSGSSVRANVGNLLLQNTTGGFINLGQNSFLSAVADGSTNGDVTIVSGPVPDDPVAGSAPANVISGIASGGQIFFGVNRFTANAPDNYVTTAGASVIFDAPATDMITLNGNVIINGTSAGDLPYALITSLDLVNDPNAIQLLLDLQTAGVITGTLQLVGSDLVGTATLLPSNLALSLSATYIPDTVTLTMEDFQTINPFTVNLTASSTTSQALIAGTIEFVGTGPTSNVVFNVNSTQAGPVLVFQSSGLLSSDGTLHIASNGDVATAAGGLIQTPVLTVASTGSMTLVNDGNITLQSSSVDGSLSISTINDGDITIGYYAVITAGDDITVNADGSGNILDPFYNGVLIAADTVNLISGTGNIGEDDWTSPLLFQANTVTVNTEGSAWINNCWFCTSSAPTYLGTSTVGGSLHVVACCEGPVTVAPGAMVQVNTLDNSTDFTTFYVETNGYAFNVGAGATVEVNGTVGNPAYVQIYTGGAPMTVETGGSLTISGDGYMELWLVNSSDTNGLINNGTIGTESGGSNGVYIYNEWGMNGFFVGGTGNYTGDVYLNSNFGTYSSVYINTTDSIFTDSYIDTSSNTGNGGNVTLLAGYDVSINGGSDYIVASATGTSGNGGTVIIGASNTLSLQGIDTSANTGNGGNIDVTTNDAWNNGGNTIDASSYVSGNAGYINIQNNGDLTLGNLNAFATANGSGGLVTVNGSNNVNLGSISSYTDAETGNGGNVNVQAVSNIILGSVDSYAGSVLGQAGDVIVSTPAGSITLSSIDASTPGVGSDGIVTLSSLDDLTVTGDIAGGEITLLSQIGPINAPDSITAINGSVLIWAMDDTVGSIHFANGESITTTSYLGNTIGNVFIFLGSPPPAETNTTAPANVTSNPTNGGQIFFGANSISASAPTNTINANNNKVVFNVGNGTASDITLGGNVTINATGFDFQLTSLDLVNDSTAVQNILDLQAAGQVGGSLLVNGSNQATGGNAIIPAEYLTGTLTAYNIPANVTISMLNFTGSEQVSVSITGTSSTTQALLNGTNNFVWTTATAAPTMTFNSNQVGTVLMVGSTGQLLSEAGMHISANRSVEIDGIIQTAGDLSVITSNGSITLSNDVTTAPTSGNGGSVVLTATTTIEVAGINTSPNGPSGTAGDITITAPGGVTGTYLNAVGASEAGGGGNISVTAILGAIEFTSFIDASSSTAYSPPSNSTGDAGTITLITDDDITFLSLRATGGRSGGNGGNISLSSEDGSIISTGTEGASFIDSSACDQCTASDTNAGTAGFISISAGSNLIGAPSVRADGGVAGGTGGQVGIDVGGSADLSFVSASAQAPFATSGTGNAGEIVVLAVGDITGTSFRTQGGVTSGNGGVIGISSSTGSVTATSFIDSQSQGSGTGGDIDIEAQGDIEITSFVRSNAFSGSGVGDAGTIEIVSNSGSVTTGDIVANANGTGSGGNVGIIANTDISTGFIAAYSGAVSGAGGNIDIEATNGSITTTGYVDADSPANGSAGHIDIDALGDITIGAYLNTAGGTGTGDGGNIDVTSTTGNISIASFISSRARTDGQGGDISLEATQGTIRVLAAGTIGDGLNSAIASNGAASYSAGNISIIYGNVSTFVIDASNNSITNGVKGPISARAIGSGTGGDILFINNAGNLDITLNSTVTAVSTSGGLTGAIILNYNTFAYNPTASVVVTGNNNGQLLGDVYGTGVDANITLSRSNAFLSIGDFNTTNGSLTVISHGDMQITGNLDVVEGNLIIQNSDTTDGTIIVQPDKVLSASTTTSSLGRVYIFIGSSQPSGTNTTAPANVDVNNSNGGVTYFGTNNISAAAPDNIINNDGSEVIFDTGSLSDFNIFLGGNVTINAQAAGTPTGGPVYSLDFTDPDLTALIISLQQSTDIGGTLQVNEQGIATGGNAIIGNNMLALELTSVNIPTGVTITFDGFTTSNQLNVNISSSSYSNVATISGTAEFITSGSPSGGLITIASDQASQNGRPAFLLTGTGQLTSDGSLSVSASGNMTLAGTVSADTNLTLATTANNGNINITGPVSATNSVSLSVNGNGKVTGTVDSPALSFASSMGNLGSSTGSRFNSSAQSISVNTGGDAFIGNTSTGTLTVGATSVRNIDLTNNRAVNLSSTLQASQSALIVVTGDNGGVTLNDNFTAPNWMALVAHGTGDIVQNGGTIRSSSLYLSTGSGDIGSSGNPIQTNAFYTTFITSGGEVHINSSNSVRVHNPSSGSTVDITSNGQIEVAQPINSTGSVTFHGAGSIILSADITATSFVSLYGNGHGNIINNGGSIITPTLTTETSTGVIGTENAPIETTADDITSSNTSDFFIATSATPTSFNVSAGYVGLTLNVDGDLGSSGSPYNTSVNQLTLNVIGSAYVNTATSLILGNSTVRDTVQITTGNNLTVNDLVTTTGSITLIANSGALTITAGSTVQANEGNVTLQNNSATGSIFVGNGATVKGFTISNPSFGNVTMTVGSSVGTSGSAPGNVTENIVADGQIVIGNNGFTSNNSGNTLDALDRTITIDAGATGSIVLDGDVLISADPPMPQVTAPSEIANILPLLSITGNTPANNSFGVSTLTVQPVVLDTTLTPQPLNIDRPSEPETTNESVYKPIAYTATSAPSTTAIITSTGELAQISLGTCLVRHAGFADVSCNQGNVNLHSGEILVHSPQLTTVNAGEYSISVDSGSVALITREGSVVKVRALHESHTNAIVISASSHAIKLSIGQEVILAPSSAHLRVAVQNDNLGRRHVVDAELANGHAISRSEFSHIGLMEQSTVLNKLIQSKSPADKQLANKLVKTAACLMTVTGAHGAFTGK